MEIGNLAEWVGATLTFLALLAAVYQLWRTRVEAREAREREFEAMARAVGVTASWEPIENVKSTAKDGLMSVQTQILNASSYPISGAVLVLAADDYPKEVVYGTILPGQILKDSHVVRRAEVVFGELTSGAELQFSDAYGNHWARSTHDVERRVEAARIC